MKKTLIYLGITLPIGMILAGVAYCAGKLGASPLQIVLMLLFGLVPLGIIAAFVANKEE